MGMDYRVHIYTCFPQYKNILRVHTQGQSQDLELGGATLLQAVCSGFGF